MEETRLLRGLRAVRRYAARPVAEDALRDILETARWTGSAKNTQPWELVVVRDRATLDQLATLGQYAGHLAGAPLGLALVLAGPGAAFDEGRLAQTLMLAAWAHGVGSCIASLYPEANQQRARDLLGVPAGRTLRTVIALGYPADAAERVAAGRAGRGARRPEAARGTGLLGALRQPPALSAPVTRPRASRPARPPGAAPAGSPASRPARPPGC